MSLLLFKSPMPGQKVEVKVEQARAPVLNQEALRNVKRKYDEANDIINKAKTPSSAATSSNVDSDRISVFKRKNEIYAGFLASVDYEMKVKSYEKLIAMVKDPDVVVMT